LTSGEDGYDDVGRNGPRNWRWSASFIDLRALHKTEILKTIIECPL